MEEPTRLRGHVKTIGKLGSIYALGAVAPRVLQLLLLLPIFTHYLDKSQMGIVALSARVGAPLVVLVQLGLFAAMKMQYFRTDESLRPGLVRTVLVGQTVQAAVVCTLLSVAGIWIADLMLPNLPLSGDYVLGLWLMIVWACPFTALTGLATGTAQLMQRADASVAINLLQFVLQAGFGVAAVVGLGWLGFGRQATILAASVIVGTLSFGLLWRQGEGRFDRSLYRRIRRVGLTFVPHTFSGLAAVAINVWLLNKLLNTDALGIYWVAGMFPQLIPLLATSSSHAAYPTLARLMTDATEHAKKQQSRLYTLMLIAMVGIALGLVLFSPLAIELLTAPGYHAATEVVWILVLAWLLQGIYQIVSQPVYFFGGGLWLSTATISSLDVNVALCPILIPNYGIQGAAWAMVGCFATRAVVAACASVYLYRIPWQVTAFLRLLLCAGALAAFDYWVSPHLALPWTIAVKTVSFLLLPPALWVLGVVSTSECRQAKEAVVRRFRT